MQATKLPRSPTVKLFRIYKFHEPTKYSMKTINRKIPGFLPPPPKTEVDGIILNLSSKTVPELQELLERQVKLLKNKAFISKLPDKGAKIQAFHDKVVEQLKAKNEADYACDLLKNLTIKGISKESMQNIEWNGRNQPQNSVLDSDDDSGPEDVMHILSQSTAKERTVIVLPPDKNLITPEDLIQIGEAPHVKYIVDKTENNSNTTNTRQYKPYKTTKSDVHNPEKEMARKKGKHWEVTAATPPLIVHGPVKILSIEESLKLQIEHDKHLKEVESRHAAEKLLARTGVRMPELPLDVSKFGEYREVVSDDESEPDPEDCLVIDEEEPDKGGVVFTVTE